MASDWQDLTRLTGNAKFLIERIRLSGKDIAIEGQFELPPLAQLTAEDQVFVMAFVRSHGSIKEMERLFGISYPTVKNRLQSITELFPTEESKPDHARSDILDALERGEISAEEAIEKLSN